MGPLPVAAGAAPLPCPSIAVSSIVLPAAARPEPWAGVLGPRGEEYLSLFHAASTAGGEEERAGRALKLSPVKQAVQLATRQSSSVAQPGHSRSFSVSLSCLLKASGWSTRWAAWRRRRRRRHTRKPASGEG